ncbi:MAG: iron-sulfur cluster assembly scaffold protein [Clostridiales bacterium]|nr:iron-sulfur cluster assembly scaffold protein [Clostridiales bacterium]
MYSGKVIENVMCPWNVHSMPDADAEGIHGDSSCVDSFAVYLKVMDNIIYYILHCSNLGASALHNAINNYLEMKRMEDSYENSNSCR